jgi:hypothetical protein
MALEMETASDMGVTVEVEAVMTTTTGDGS